MHSNAFPQQSSQTLEKSTTMWSTPSTDEQKRYFSKHAPKRRIYGMIQVVLQVLHGFLAFAAWYMIFAWAFTSIPALQPFAGGLAAILLIVFHMLFRTTWDTYWYDRLDDDPNTDSSIWIPGLILVVLLVTEATGARIFLEAQVKPAAIKTTEQVDQSRDAQASRAQAEYDAQVTRIQGVYKEKKTAAALPYNSRISQLRSRRLDTPEERRTIYNQIAALERQRDEATAAIAQAKAGELESALKSFQGATSSITQRHNNQLKEVDTHNTGETTRVQQGLQSAKSSSWLISLALIILIAALGYARVRINVKSGILPRRNFTVLDAHGGIFARLGTAIGDAWNRQSLKGAVAIHRALSPKEDLQTFDGTVVARQGRYNTPEGVLTAQNTPAAPTPSQDLGEAYEKVWKKVQQIQQQYPGYTPNRGVLNQELTKAMMMNGSYAGDAWDDESLGKS